jgi:hypothetical protein
MVLGFTTAQHREAVPTKKPFASVVIKPTHGLFPTPTTFFALARESVPLWPYFRTVFNSFSHYNKFPAGSFQFLTIKIAPNFSLMSR